MKTLPEILRDAKLLLERPDYEHKNVVIARGQSPETLEGQTLPPSQDKALGAQHWLEMSQAAAVQIRLWLKTDDAGSLDLYRCEACVWSAGSWSAWYARRGWSSGAAFNIQDVLATDWRIVTP